MMPRHTKSLFRLVLVGAPLALTACATAPLHTAEEINAVGRMCDVALGELFQDESEKKLLFLLKPGATLEQRRCVQTWARKNHLKPVIVDNIQFPES